MRDDHNDRRNGAKARLSWSEVDKIRDQSRHRDQDPMQKQSSPVALAAQKSYRAALERAFEAGKLGELAKSLARPDDPASSGAGPTPPRVTPQGSMPLQPVEVAPLPPAPTPREPDPERENRQKLIAKVRAAEGRDSVTRAVDAFLAKYPKLPDDYELLTKALAHKDYDRVRAVLDQLTAMLAKEKPRRGRALAAQLRFLEDTNDDPGIRRYAAEVRNRL